MSRNGKVIVAMSGGVDSSVAACLLKEQGYECVGVFMRVGVEQPEDDACALDEAAPPRKLKHGCCSANDAQDAKAVAGKLGLPFYALNFRDDFEQIIDYFVDEYGRARTPNPCIMCNQHLKFGKLLRYADMLEAEFVATGHYARVLDVGGRPRLAQSLNPAKDQSYVLFGIRPDEVARCKFPLGEIADKADVRKIAESLALEVHDKPDSQEICFVPGGDYKQLVQQRRPDAQQPGEVRDAEGRVVGQHEGVPNYTIGQRRGLALAMGYPIYVVGLDADANTVTVGRKEELERSGLVAEAMNWFADPPAQPLDVTIKIRHQHTPTPGRVQAGDEGTAMAHFDTPQIAVTPGQAAVFYDDDGLVVGGGWIEKAVTGAE